MLFLGLPDLLRCGFVCAALATAVTAGTTTSSLLFRAAFGLGTSPAMFGVRVIGRLIDADGRTRLQRVAPVGLAVVGLLLLLRGLGLGGLLSPILTGSELNTLSRTLDRDCLRRSSSVTRQPFDARLVLRIPLDESLFVSKFEVGKVEGRGRGTADQRKTVRIVDCRPEPGFGRNDRMKAPMGIGRPSETLRGIGPVRTNLVQREG